MEKEKRMTARRTSWIVYSALVILLGLAIIAASISVFAVGMLRLADQDASVGIIGGASGHTAEYLARKLEYTVGQLFRFGILVTLTGIIATAFNRFFSKHCAVETSVTSIVISAVVGLGLSAVMWFAACYFLDHPKNHPIRHPASFIFGVICFVVFLCLIGLYTFLRFRKPSVKGILIDVAVSLVYAAPFWTLFINMYEPLAEIIKKALGI